MRPPGPARAAAGALAIVLGAGCGGERKEPSREPGPAPGDGAPRAVSVFFSRDGDCDVHPVPRTVPGGDPVAVARATLEALLAGPTPEERAAGYVSAFPDSHDVREWRQFHLERDLDPPRERAVGLREVRALDHRFLLVDFTRALNAYGGGSTRVCTIVRQLEATVEQFPEFADVRISIEGVSEGILQP